MSRKGVFFSWWRCLQRDQRGLVLPLVLGVVAVGMAVVLPSLLFTSAGSIASSKARQNLMHMYASDGGVEHALWRLARDDPFTFGLTPETPASSYTLVTNGVDTQVTVRFVPPSPPSYQTNDRIVVTLDIEPDRLLPGDTSPLTFTLTIGNIGPSRVMTEQVGRVALTLDPGFSYVPNSLAVTQSPGARWFDRPPVEFTSRVEGEVQYLEKTYGSPRPRLDPDAWVTFTFQVTPPQGGSYYIKGWTVQQPDSIDLVESPPVFLFIGWGSTFDILSQTPKIVVRSAGGLDRFRQPSVRSWM